MSIFDSIVKDVTSKAEGALQKIAGNYGLSSFTNPYGSEAPRLRYPLGDVQRHQNVIHFEALTRIKKSRYLDAASPNFVKNSLGSVTLYMPSGIEVNGSLQYDNADTGLGGEALNAAGNSASMSEAAGELKGQSKGLVDSMAAKAIASGSQMKSLGGETGNAFKQVAINRGEVVNPHTQMLFKAPTLRTFDYSFKLIPRSLAEAREIIKIVRFFRVAAYPELTSGGTGEGVDMSTYKFPDIFKITYLTGAKENSNIIKVPECYLTNVVVTYNSQSATFYDNGMPSEVDIKLSFQESKAINRAQILDEGY